MYVNTADPDYFLFLLPLLSSLIALGQTHFELNSPHLGQKLNWVFTIKLTNTMAKLVCLSLLATYTLV